MQNLPPGLDLDSLPGPKRGVDPAIYFRDESVASPSGRYFALAYTIFEATDGNEVGRVLWGQVVEGRAEILGNPGVLACCWSSPWASWINDEAFVFKAHFHDGERTYLPLVVFHMKRGFAVVPGTNSVSSRPSKDLRLPRRFEPIWKPALLRAIAQS